MKVMTVFGTRPEMIKMWPVLKKLDEYDFEHIMVHTGQNHTPELKDFIIRDLELRAPDYELGIDTTSYGREVADVVSKTDELIKQHRPDALLVLGDTYSGLSVMPAAHHGVRIFHMEAGLRAWDVRMPEQRNRILIDHMSSVLLPFNQYHRENLIRENIHPSKIFVTGNPTYETMRAFADRIDACDLPERLGLTRGKYVAVTAHRSENVDTRESLQSIFDALRMLAEELDMDVVYPIHPRTRSKLGPIEVSPRVRLLDPMGFIDFNAFQKHAFCLLADSGTTPEESLWYRVPCVSLRRTTERPETVEAGAHVVAGLQPRDVVDAVVNVTSQPWEARYDLSEGFSPSSVVINVLRSRITNFF
ncbi:MAG TPA: UDP-N-acetylglucosamine 2-epimerase (non-hydrolyzing) [Longimicrobium sp.]|nr:UDP-N-acetylglucosamine 2-epimerase (non-hydrolyzing) [Longimicrobium sp.]